MDEMFEIVECPDCKKPEYYGMIHWKDGKQHCRKCIYEIWAKESKYKWERSKSDYIFPFYDDGIDHTK